MVCYWGWGQSDKSLGSGQWRLEVEFDGAHQHRAGIGGQPEASLFIFVWGGQGNSIDLLRVAFTDLFSRW